MDNIFSKSINFYNDKSQHISQIIFELNDCINLNKESFQDIKDILNEIRLYRIDTINDSSKCEIYAFNIIRDIK